MSFRDEMDEMQRGITKLVTVTLSKIHENSTISTGVDLILDENFKKHFLEVAEHTFSDAYKGFVIEGTLKRSISNTTNDNVSSGSDDDVKIVIDKIKSEPVDNDDAEDANSKETVTGNIQQLVDQETTVSQSTTEIHADFNENIVKNVIKIEPSTSTLTDDVVDERFEAEAAIPDETPAKIRKCSILNGIMFYCVHCQDAELQSEAYNSVDGIHKHWLTKHAKEAQPFRFYVGSTCVCGICGKNGTFREIKYHFQVRHLGQQVVIVNNLVEKKCGICCCDDEMQLTLHFRYNHSIITSTDVFNPIRISKSILQKLNSIAMHQKYKCNVCAEMFETEALIHGHFAQSPSHVKHKMPYEKFYEKRPPYFHCGLCDKSKMDKEEFNNHIKNHELKCMNCNTFKGKYYELDAHNSRVHSIESLDEYLHLLKKGYFRTKVVYANGLVLNIHSLLEPNDNECGQFNSIFGKRGNGTASQPVNRVESQRRISLERSPRPFGSLKDVPYHAKIEQLHNQNEFLNMVNVSGLPMANCVQKNLLQMFINLCKYIGEPMELEDIESIEIDNYNQVVTVKLRDRVKKERILKRTRHFGYLKSDAFLKLSPGASAVSVFIFPKVTKYYDRLTKTAKKHLQNGKLHAYRISSQGLGIRRTRESPEVFAKSCKELDDLVFGFTQTTRKRKHSESSPKSTSSTPQQMKFY